VSRAVEEPVLSLSKEPAVAFAFAVAFLVVIPEGGSAFSLFFSA
jgi:hypothetical protein